ncbi:Medium-chain-fatty-acid--CoA ligase [hydrothermal vent metagenome]|uniref:Medium-chain-fatty-acid--CoA ligase n=1 Tax=hydrothermal vent metagenome TaxID=652676 RepID=A0A3B0UQA8_9ZZZZ
MLKTKILPPTEEAYAYPLLIKRILADSLKYEPNNEIVYRDLTRYNYFELNKRIRKLANVLQNLGIQAGDVVAVLEYDSPRYLELFFAIPMIGAVLHTVNYRLSPEQVLYTMNHAEDKIVFTNTDFIPLLKGIKDKLTASIPCILMTDKEELPEEELVISGEYEELLRSASDLYEFPDFDENSVATMFYTTGTTGNPKAVYFSHRQLVLHTLAGGMLFGSYDSACRFRSDDVYMPITPMFHVHAWGVPYLATMLGVKQVYPGRYEPEMLLRLLLSEKVTFSHCVPTILHMLVSSPVAKAVDLSHWKVVIGGAALPAGLAKAASELNIDVITGYGMSETCPILSVTYLNKEGRKVELNKQVELRTKTGVPIPLVDMKVVDENMKTLPQDGESVGEIVVRTPWLTQSYYKEEEKSKELWKGGYLHTGDVAYVDSKNFFKITDRIKDVIKTGGEWISSLELENLISKHPSVSEVAVVGVPDPKWSERPYAIVVPKVDAEATPEDIRQFLQQFVDNGTINKWAIPSRIDFVLAIPKTSVGKIDKKRIRAEYRE